MTAEAPAALNSIERLKAERNGLTILDEIEAIAAEHGGWETLNAETRERLKWIGTFYRKPTPGKFMMRIRITAGQATTAQLRALARIASTQGNGVLDITTRQQLELRAINIKDVPGIMAAIEDVDLTSLQTGLDNIRNVNTCPMAGLTPGELLDAGDICRELTSIFLNNPDYTNLPRKFNVAITGCLENCTHTETQDVGMYPAIRKSDGKAGFNVIVGGKMGSGGMTVATPLDVWVDPADAARLAAEIILVFRDFGSRESRSRARLAFLIEDWGIERFRDVLEQRWGKPFERAGQDVRFFNKADHMGVKRQKRASLYSVGLSVPAGRITSDKLAGLADLADWYGDGTVRLTPDQNVIIANVPEAKLDALLAHPLLKEMPADAHPLIRGLVSCVGTDYCNLALIETKGLGKALAERLAAKIDTHLPLTMNWSGCPASCGNHMAADIGLQGLKARIDGEVVDAVTIFVGGRTGPDARPGHRLMEVVPVTMLDDIIPLVISNLETLRKVQKVPEAEDAVLMVPAVSDTRKKEVWE